MYKNGTCDYLVKWRELPYDQCTWETDDFEIPAYKEAIEFYWYVVFY